MWTCQGCGEELDVTVTDSWCHHCLDGLRQKLALALLNRNQYGMSYGPDLPTFFREPVFWREVGRRSWAETLRELD